MPKFYSKGIAQDQKVRLTTKNPIDFGTGLMDPLKRGKVGYVNGTAVYGVVFPYTPNIQISHDVNYGTYDLTHTNYQPHYYVNSTNPTLSMSAQMTAQTFEEAAYTAAAIQFFKSCTKMSFGTSKRGNLAASDRSGMPPPVLILSGYGGLNIENVPVIIKNFSYTLPEDVDYITFQSGGQNHSVPTSVMISLSFGVQQNPEKMKNFDLDGYKTGNNVRGWI